MKPSTIISSARWWYCWGRDSPQGGAPLQDASATLAHLSCVSSNADLRERWSSHSLDVLQAWCRPETRLCGCSRLLDRTDICGSVSRPKTAASTTRARHPHRRRSYRSVSRGSRIAPAGSASPRVGMATLRSWVSGSNPSRLPTARRSVTEPRRTASGVVADRRSDHSHRSASDLPAQPSRRGHRRSAVGEHDRQHSRGSDAQGWTPGRQPARSRSSTTTSDRD